MTKYAEELDTATAVLAAARADRAIADVPRPDLLQAAVDWAAMHSVDSIEDAATICEAGTATPGCRSRVRVRRWWRSSRSPSSPPRSGCPPMRVSGTSATPWSSRHRLPRVWRRVVKGDLRAWLARRIADQTLLLSPEGRVVRGPARRAMWRTRSDPSSSNGWWTRRSRRSCPSWPRNAGWRRRTAGTSPSSSSRSPTPAPATVHGELDLADALDLEQAVAGLAAQLKDLGSTDSLNVRRAAAVGELARHQLALDLASPVVEEGAPRPSRNHHTEATGRPLRPPLPGRPRRRRHREAGAGQPADHRRPGPRLVRHRRQRRREAGAGPRSPRPRRLRRRPRPARRD